MCFLWFFASENSHKIINKKEAYDIKVIKAITYEYSYTKFLRKLNSSLILFYPPSFGHTLLMGICMKQKGILTKYLFVSLMWKRPIVNVTEVLHTSYK